MKIFENPTIKISRFQKENILTASSTPTALELAQNDAAKMGADKLFTITVQW